MDSAAVRALFSDYSPTLTRTAAELEAALHRHGYAGPLSDWLAILRAGGLREPRRGVFGAPWEPTESREITGNYSGESDKSRYEAGINPTPANEATPPELPADSRSKAVIADPVSTAPEPPQFSYFRGGIRSAAPYAVITPRQLWEMIHGPLFVPATSQLRQAPAGSEARAEWKKRLDYVTPAGTFAPTRANGNLVAPSGLLVLDFDHLPDVSAARATLLADPLLSPALVVLFTSPAGKG
ncbi:BT4734/BF3469 family protein [Hymenobacter sp. AT01-02]|uniref:BT4734/BF3469 family protein n=1 Tax=Hymenobacter sp. AT01-02 TaxID=1571877 RepID=UPI000AD61D57|nr:BT4734/BF3469 family protein [Hymenobacter sp. AT01-02]